MDACDLEKTNRLLLDVFKTQRELAGLLCVAPATVCEWFATGKWPPLRALEVERLSAGRIAARRLNSKLANLVPPSGASPASPAIDGRDAVAGVEARG